MNDIGKFIAEHRKRNGYNSQRQLAAESDISAATISRIESNIQKPNMETLKSLSKYLKTTSHVELMVVAGYWDEDELLEPINTKNNDIKEKTPSSNKTEKDFIKKLDLSDTDLIKQFNLELDGKKLTEDEAKGVIAYLRSLRQIDK